MNYFLISVVVLLMFSCTKDKGLPSTDTNSTAGTMDPCASNISYSINIVPIINNSCALSGCHTPTGFKDFSSYNAIKTEIIGYTPSLYLSRIKPGGGMPQIGSPLGSCEIKQIETWLNSGYPNN
jgi:hypothetical protein